MADRYDEQERRERDRRREYGRGYEPEWGDYPYRGETWRMDETGDRAYRPGIRGDFTGRGPKGYQRSDARIHEDVCDRLADAPHIDASDIEVQTTNGEVTLSGSVREREEKRRAEDLLDGVSGVREVHNNLRVNTSR